jgi:hypothetical protein
MGKLGTLRKRAQGITGIITVACGFFMMWGSARGSVEQHEMQQGLYEKASPIDARVPNAELNGQLVLAGGRFSSTQQLEDDFLQPSPFLVLRRRVEMYQWIEDRAGSSGTPEYRLGWFEGQVDFFRFQNPTGHENPLLRFEAFNRSIGSSSFGAFDGTVLLRSVRALPSLELRSDMLKDPSQRIENNKIYVPRDPTMGEGVFLGDMRVWYEALPQGEYTVLTVQKDERNLVGAEPSEELVVRQGDLSKDEFFGAERQDVGRVSTGLLYLGGILFFAGLCSVLAPLAPRINLRPRIAADGMLAVVLLSAGFSLIAVCFFFLVGYF